MKYALLALSVLVSGCSSDYLWNNEPDEPKAALSGDAEMITIYITGQESPQ